jgi:hypothetical protein
MAHSAILGANAASFFLKDGVPLVTTRAHTKSKTTALAAAIDQPCVDAVRMVCRGRGWTLGFIAPSAVGLARAFEDRWFLWADGSLVVEVTQCGGEIESGKELPLPRLDPGLATLGEGALRYADAYGVAVIETIPPLSLDALAAGFWTRNHVRRRLMLPAILLLTGITALLLSPLAAVWAEHRAEARLAGVRDEQVQTVVSTLSVLDRTTAILEDAQAFAHGRSSATALLAELARGLPRGSVLVSLDLGETQGELIALCPSPADVLDAVARLPGARAVELVGPVQREAIAGRDVRRVTVRWRRESS